MSFEVVTKILAAQGFGDGFFLTQHDFLFGNRPGNQRLQRHAALSLDVNVAFRVQSALECVQSQTLRFNARIRGLKNDRFAARSIFRYKNAAFIANAFRRQTSGLRIHRQRGFNARRRFNNSFINLFRRFCFD